MNILITGGAGYIGSHVAKQILETTNYSVVIVDNLSTGNRETIEKLKTIRAFTFIEQDLNEFEKVNQILKEQSITTIMHFAASIVVPESIEKPLKYYMNNSVNTTNLIECAIQNGVEKFIFSSTAAVYGEPTKLPPQGIDEKYQKEPINPYGMSKLISEQILQDSAKVYDLKYVIFRYFNVAGADIFYRDNLLSPRIGQSFPQATHLIKIASECAVGKREKMAIYGDDFDTHDGTGVRDYIHVDDLARAHIQAIEYLDSNESDIFNVGYGQGYSVKEVIETLQKVTGVDFTVEMASRRLGDPAALIANNSKIKTKMGWQPKYNDLALICQSAYLWEKRG